jgi:hypothetical protein
MRELKGLHGAASKFLGAAATPQLPAEQEAAQAATGVTGSLDDAAQPAQPAGAEEAGAPGEEERQGGGLGQAATNVVYAGLVSALGLGSNSRLTTLSPLALHGRGGLQGYTTHTARPCNHNQA